MKKNIIVFLLFQNLLLLSTVYSQDIKNKIGIGFHIGPGIGYQKIDENSRRHPLDGRNPDSDIDYSGFVILYCIGSEYYIKLDRFCCFFQFKQKIGSTDYEFNSKRVLNYPEGIIKGNVSLNGFEIVMGFKIFI